MPWVGLADAPAWKFYRVHSFLDYIMGGCQIHFTVSARDPHCHPAPLPAPPHPAEPLHARRARAPSPPEQWAVCIPGCSKAPLEGPPPPAPWALPVPMKWAQGVSLGRGWSQDSASTKAVTETCEVRTE